MTNIPTAGTKADRDRLRRRMGELGCNVAEIAAEMRSAFRMRPREAWRHAHGWTLQQLAERVTEEGGPAADPSLVGHWERWPQTSASRRPTIPVLSALAGQFGCTVDQLLDFADRQAMPAAELAAIRQVYEKPRVSSEVVTAGRNRDVLPPPSLEKAGPALVRTVAEESAVWAAWAESSNVGELSIEQLLADIRSVAKEYLTDDPSAVFMRTKNLRDRVFALLEGHQKPTQTRDLYVAAGYLCALLAWMSSDFGHLREAETQGRTAWLCSELAGDNELRAWVLSTRSKIAFWDNRLKEAIQYARHGASYTVVGTVTALLACQEADAWSQVGAEGEARAALAAADDARDSLTGLDDIAGVFSCPAVRLANYATSAHLRLGDPAAALRTAEDAIRTLGSHSYGTTAQIHIALSQAHVRLGETEGAAESLRPVLDIAPDHRMAPVTRRMLDLAAELGRTRVGGTEGAALQMKIHTWCRSSAALSPGQGAT